MSNVVKPVIPREVADALKTLRAAPYPYDNAKIVDLAIEQTGKTVVGPTIIAIRSIPFDTLLAALVNGYDVEKTAEEEKRKEALRRIRNAYRDTIGASYGSYCDGVGDGIKRTLNELGISIEGVNA